MNRKNEIIGFLNLLFFLLPFILYADNIDRHSGLKTYMLSIKTTKPNALWVLHRQISEQNEYELGRKTTKKLEIKRTILINQ